MNEALYFALGVFAAIVVLAGFSPLTRIATVHETQRGLLFRHGKFQRVLGPGRHRTFGTGYKVEHVDMRALSQVIGNQEIATKDGVPIKVSLIVNFAVADPYSFKTKYYDAYTELHQAVQVALRGAVMALNVEEFVENRARVTEPVLTAGRSAASALGLELHEVSVRDVIIGGGIKAAMADIVRAQYEGRAALERARAESATMRSLANTARMLEEQPALERLRLLQAIEAGKATVVIGADASITKLGK